MLSGETSSVQINKIWVDRGKRARKIITEEAIAEKMESISRIGLIHYPVITREFELVAGETRWIACQRLGHTSLPIQWADTLDPREMMKIEYEENYKRTDLPWQDQCDFLQRYHAMMLEDEPTWTQAQTAEAFGLNQSTVSEQLAVAEALTRGDTRVVGVKQFTTVVGIVRRQKERAKSDELSMLKIGNEDDVDAPGIHEENVRPASPIITASFLDWLPTYTGPSFNLLHCDFPYGINADKFNQGSADAYGGYDDSPEIYWALVSALINNRDKLLGSSGHIIFWFSMRYYTETLAALSQHFRVDPYPLVWHKSDNKGTLPDPERGPRRVYEVAFLCSYGDRKIIQPVSNTFSGPTIKSVADHMSEKSEDMLAHFMRMLVDDNTRLLDPTCGSGSALRAARRLGAASVMGLEMNPEFADNARRAWDAGAQG